MFTRIKEIDKKCAISFFMGLVFGGLGIYAGFFFQRSPNIDFTILSNSNVVDVHTELSKLDLIYDGLNIKNTKKNLKLITLKIINSGNKGVVEQDYATNHPMGIKIKNGTIVESPNLVQASNNYLEQSINFTLIDSSRTVVFSNVILDPDDFFEIKLLLLHDKFTHPHLTPIGKIANIKRLNIIDVKEAESKKSKFYEKAKNIFSTILLSLLLGFFGAIFLILIPLGLIKEKRNLKRRNKIFKSYKDFKGINVTNENSFVYKYYMKKDKEYLKKINDLISDKPNIKKLMPLLAQANKIEKSFFASLRTRSTDSNEKDSEFGKLLDDLQLLEKLVRLDFIILNNSNYSIDKDLKYEFDEFLEFLAGRDL